MTKLGRDECLQGRCYYCGRDLISAAPLSRAKTAALWRDTLTCGPCVWVRGLLPYREGAGGRYTWQRILAKKAFLSRNGGS